MRERRGAPGRVAWLLALLLAFTVTAGASGSAAQATSQQQLEQEVPELRGLTDETPRVAADAMVRSLLARFEQLATKSGDAAEAALRSKVPEAAALLTAPAFVPEAPPGSPLESPLEPTVGSKPASPSTEPAPPAQGPRPVDPIYRFVDRAGHVVYTNIIETVPLAQRERGKLELRLIPLDTELGSELSARLRQEHATRIKAPVCDQLRRAIDVPPSKRLWDEHAPLVGGAAAIVVFTLYLSSLMGRFGVSLSMRVLATIIPLMAVFALGALGYEQARTSMQAQQEQAAPCLADSFSRLTRGGGGLDQQAELLRSLIALQARAGATSATSATNPGSIEP